MVRINTLSVYVGWMLFCDCDWWPVHIYFVPVRCCDGIVLLLMIMIGNKRVLRTTGTSDYEIPCAIAVDREWVYVTGTTAGNLNGNRNHGRYDIFLVKYDMND